MYNPYGDEPRLNRFLLISVVLHAILFFTLPDLGSLLEADVPGMAGAGVIQIMHVERSVNPRPSPITDPLAQGTVPRVTEPRPQPEQPAQEEAVAQPKPPVVEDSQVERASPELPDVPTTPEPQPAAAETPPAPFEPPTEEVPDEVGPGEVLTSESGPEVVVEPQIREEVKPPVEPRPEPEERPTAQNVSGSGTGTGGSSDEPGTGQSGTGTAETAPPPPPPPASGRGLHGGGVPTYPKNAEHDGVEGVVILVLEVSADGELMNLVLEKSSGDARLDFQATRYIGDMWTFASQPYDYSMQVAVVFSREDNRFVSSVEYGEVSWLNAP